MNIKFNQQPLKVQEEIYFNIIIQMLLYPHAPHSKMLNGTCALYPVRAYRAKKVFELRDGFG